MAHGPFAMAPLQLGKLKSENALMNATKTVRVVLAVLWGFFLALYVASKIRSFTRYDPLGIGSYLREHSTYWGAMAAVVFLIWLVGKQFPQDRQEIWSRGGPVPLAPGGGIDTG